MGDITIKWAGTNVEGTGAGGLGSRSLQTFDFGGFDWAAEVADTVWGGKVYGSSLAPDVRRVMFWLHCEPPSNTMVNMLRWANDEVASLSSTFSPSIGVTTLEVERYNYAGTLVERYVQGAIKRSMGWTYVSQGGDRTPGIRPRGYIRWPVEVECIYPWFVDMSTYSTTAMTTGGGPYTITNGGDIWTGWRLEVTGSTGTPLGCVITNATTGYSIDLRWTAGPTSGDWVDYFYPSSAWTPVGFRSGASGAAPSNRVALLPGPAFTDGRLAKGNNSITVALPTGGTGSLSFNFIVRRRWETI